MSLPEQLLRDRAGLTDPVVVHLQRLLGDWQILADLSFADLLMWAPSDRVGRVEVAASVGQARQAAGFLCVGQMRPYTAQTIYVEDLVGRLSDARDRPMVARAFAEGRIIRDADPDWSLGVPVREEAIPVRADGHVVAVITREANVATARSPSDLELSYLKSAGELAEMIADGTFPYASESEEDREHSPRVGDGVIRLSPDGDVQFSSPNATSSYRRFGATAQVVGANVRDIDPHPAALLDGLQHGRAVDDELEANRTIAQRRLMPLLTDGVVTGALLLLRDVTELRRQERALRVKDATIREIHHRVKNNLQTVASLLRLQGRRLEAPEARDALTESVRRITSIALVHETLSEESRQRVPFGDITERVLSTLEQGIVASDTPIEFVVAGDPGELPAEVATPLALVLSELAQNAVEHGFAANGESQPQGGTVTVEFERFPAMLRVEVRDDGRGLPPGKTVGELEGLGLQITRVLVESELAGTFDLLETETGTGFELVLPLP